MSDQQTNLTLAATLIEVAEAMRKAVESLEVTGYLALYTPQQLDAWKHGARAMADFVETTGRSVHKRAGL